MKRCTLLLALAFLIFSCANNSSSDHRVPRLRISEFPLQSSVRAIEVVDSNTVWFAGSGGQFGYTRDGGQTWVIDSIKYGDSTLEFRSIAVTGQAVYVLSVATPALLFRSADQGQNWSLVYREDHNAAFYDAMAFWDDRDGIAIGDPTDSCLSVILTRDGGATWQKLPCSALPPLAEGEFAFAASNTNIALVDDQVWVVTGGKKARVFHSPDRGLSWTVYDTPIRQGGAMTGIFSAHFYDAQTGVIFGGDWENQEQNTQNKAFTSDGGRTWELRSDGRDPGYRSCVQFVPGSNGQELFAVGMPGISYSADQGHSWQELDKASYYTIRIAPAGNVAWLAGKNRIARMTW
ncbi:MAG: oxidoreductase [Bacteroidetes bacterium]|nr:MAG: oxidoreductase [Bacteroidota bacterium]